MHSRCWADLSTLVARRPSLGTCISVVLHAICKSTLASGVETNTGTSVFVRVVPWSLTLETW